MVMKLFRIRSSDVSAAIVEAADLPDTGRTAGQRYSQALNRPIPDKETLAQQIAAWEKVTNRAAITVDWRFTKQMLG